MKHFVKYLFSCHELKASYLQIIIRHTVQCCGESMATSLPTREIKPGLLRKKANTLLFWEVVSLNYFTNYIFIKNQIFNTLVLISFRGVTSWRNPLPRFAPRHTVQDRIAGESMITGRRFFMTAL